MSVVLGILAVFAPFIIFGFLIEGCGRDQYTPMTYDEEMKWLIEVHNLSWKEADEYARIPNQF